MLKKLLIWTAGIISSIVLAFTLLLSAQYFFPNKILAQSIQQVIGIAGFNTATNRWRWLKVDGNDNLLVSLATQLDATNDSISTLTVGGMIEQGLLELIGVDEQVAQNEYAASVIATFATDPSSGVIKKICLYATEAGTGAIITENGRVLVLDADPATTAGDTAISAAERITILADFNLLGTNYQEDANGGSNCQATDEAFHSLTSIFLLYFQEGATTWNAVAGDEERLRVNFWYFRSS